MSVYTSESRIYHNPASFTLTSKTIDPNKARKFVAGFTGKPYKDAGTRENSTQSSSIYKNSGKTANSSNSKSSWYY